MQQHRNPWRYRLIASAWLALAIPVIGCGSEVRIGGASVHEAFADPQTGALAAAAARGDVAEIDRLVQAGADVNATGKDNVTPLAIALAKRNLAGVRHLLALGADPNHVLVREQEPRQRTPLLYLVVVGDAFDERFLEAFLQHGGDPNLITSTNQSLLMLAVHKRPYVELLLRYGADINYKTAIGESTALWDAVALNQLDTAQYLLEQGASTGLEKVAVSLVLERDGPWPELAAKREELLRLLEARGVRIPTLAEIRAQQQERQRRLDEVMERKRRERQAKQDGGNHRH